MDTDYDGRAQDCNNISSEFMFQERVHAPGGQFLCVDNSSRAMWDNKSRSLAFLSLRKPFLDSCDSEEGKEIHSKLDIT